MSIKQTVLRLIRACGTNDPYEIAALKNIVVILEPLGEMMGYYHTYKRCSLIHINENLPAPMRRFVCAHELGHHMLHPKLNTPFMRRHTLYAIGKIEREANQFAVELLLPDDLRKTGATTIYETAALYGIPDQLVHLKKYDRD